MNQFEDAAEEAAAETDAKLFEKMQALTSISDDKIREIVPAADYAHAQELARAIEEHTDNNKISNAWKNFVSKASDLAIKGMRKLVLGV